MHRKNSWVLNTTSSEKKKKNKEVAINFNIPQFYNLFKLMDADKDHEGRIYPHSPQAADDGVKSTLKALLLNALSAKR